MRVPVYRAHKFSAACVVLAGCLLHSSILWAAPPTLKQELHRLLGDLPHSEVQVSACIMSLPDGVVVYERNSRDPLIPASNQKIITAAVALEALSLEFKYETQLFMKDDDLILVGSGDPALGDPRLCDEAGQRPESVFQAWADVLVQRGIKDIPGDLLIDDGVFEDQWTHPEWEEKDLPKWYAAPVGGLNYFDNCIEVTLWPVPENQEVAYRVDPPNSWIEIDNRSVLGSKSPWVIRERELAQFSLRGQCHKRVTLSPVAVHDPGLFTGHMLMHQLREKGIHVQGAVRRPANTTRPPAQAGATKIASHETPIHQVLKRAMRNSQNLFAECLMKSIGRHQVPTAPGQWSSGRAAILQTMQSWGIDVAGMVVSDGSGLSRENRASARQMVDVLRHVYMSGDAGDVYIDSLALNGKHGTLERRMKELPPCVWAKTGYLRGVRALSGFVRAGSTQWYAFSIIFNDIPGGTAPYNNIHDQVCRLLAESSS